MRPSGQHHPLHHILLGSLLRGPPATRSDTVVLDSDSLTVADSALAAIVDASSSVVGDALTRLEANLADAVSHASDAASSLSATVEQSVPAFVSVARRRMRVIGKGMVLKEEELDYTANTLESCAQQLLCDDGTAEFSEDPLNTIVSLLAGMDAFPPASTLASMCSAVAVARRVGEASHVYVGIDPARTIVSHLPWLTRERSNNVSVSLFDAAGDPVYWLTRGGTRCTVEDGADGWKLASVAVKDNTVLLEVTLTRFCSATAVLQVNIMGLHVRVPLKVRDAPLVPFASLNCITTALS